VPVRAVRRGDRGMTAKTLKTMTMAEFADTFMRQGESIVSIADIAVNAGISDDEEFMTAAKALVDAEDRFYRLMLERGLEQ
jgi:methylphosphotriester-DNA--protein-cysteine methyltransferase